MRQVVNTSGLPMVVCDTPWLTSVAASTSSQVIGPANDNRAHWQVFNDSTAVMYLAWGPTASTTLYTCKVSPNGYYELPRQLHYVGAISAVWAAANGAARVTEST